MIQLGQRMPRFNSLSGRCSLTLVGHSGQVKYSKYLQKQAAAATPHHTLMYILRKAQNPSNREFKYYFNTQQPSMEKALKDVEISSQSGNNCFFLALYKHDLKQAQNQVPYFPLRGEKAWEI